MESPVQEGDCVVCAFDGVYPNRIVCPNLPSTITSPLNGCNPDTSLTSSNPKSNENADVELAFAFPAAADA